MAEPQDQPEKKTYGQLLAENAALLEQNAALLAKTAQQEDVGAADIPVEPKKQKVRMLDPNAADAFMRPYDGR